MHPWEYYLVEEPAPTYKGWVSLCGGWIFDKAALKVLFQIYGIYPGSGWEALRTPAGAFLRHTYLGFTIQNPSIYPSMLAKYRKEEAAFATCGMVLLQ